MKLVKLEWIAAALFAVVATAAPEQRLPRLFEMVSTNCRPCEKMAPVLEELQKDYAGKLKVEISEVRINSQRAQQFEIKDLPTQIFYDAEGKELFRHEGFFGKADILAKWKELGVKLNDDK